MELFNNFFDPDGAFETLARAGHILVGIAWIGLLYFFNFVQVPAYAQLSDGARSEALRKLTWRALWWFRWAAFATFIFGLAIVSVQEMGNIEVNGEEIAGTSYFAGPGGTAILTGMLFGTTMFVNVWGIIWRNQKVVIGSAEAVANGGQADPDAPAAAKRAARASRTNTFFSFTMLWFMVFTAHGAGFYETAIGGTAVYWLFVLVLWAVVEASALGFIGGIDGPINKAVFDDHKKTIIYGFAYLAVIYVIGWELLLPA
ncbi:MAG TPA: urate hydroxylase PuuD [Acidimicrobiales bacterium]|nr:urate hydroxylase PuuD [Acidimicrobiales bacterium]